MYAHEKNIVAFSICVSIMISITTAVIFYIA